MGKQKRNAEDMRRAIDEFQKSGLTRREFCERHHIAVTTLDYWRRVQSRPARLVRVKMAARESAPGFSLSLANSRRIESGWSFTEVDLARLIRIAEST
jgi:hypothetical protein